jgi:hypothetical protein
VWIVLGRQESSFGIRHFAEVIFDELLELFGWLDSRVAGGFTEAILVAGWCLSCIALVGLNGRAWHNNVRSLLSCDKS